MNATILRLNVIWTNLDRGNNSTCILYISIADIESLAEAGGQYYLKTKSGGQHLLTKDDFERVLGKVTVDKSSE